MCVCVYVSFLFLLILFRLLSFHCKVFKIPGRLTCEEQTRIDYIDLGDHEKKNKSNYSLFKS